MNGWFIAEYNAKFDNFNVVLTGGDHQHLASHLKNRIFADPDLILKDFMRLVKLIMLNKSELFIILCGGNFFIACVTFKGTKTTRLTPDMGWATKHPPVM